MNIVEYFAEVCGFEVRPYSGRAMYGDQTLAVVLSSDKLGKMIQELITNAVDHHDPVLALRVNQWLQNLRMDSMGMDMVVYSSWFPMTEAEKECLDQIYNSDED